jgi:hypothetical protein
MIRPLDVVFRDAFTRYPVARRDEKFGRESSFWPLIAELKQALEAVPALAASKRAKVKVSFGQGAWAEVPNFALMDTRETERPSAGLYMVYLMRADASGVVLSLNQGSADLILEARGRVYDVLAARAGKAREALKLEPLRDAGFTGEAIDLASTGQYPRAYAAGSIVAKSYPAAAIPSVEALMADLAVLYAAYQSVIPSSRLRLADVGRATQVRSPLWRA